ncbi:hypothetical protein PPL_06679 [Heterostelium album PN500]|uniref:Uncharacterized protein n=1 Tax=Heterostelium pallidum (strain ATCC 26659 / Pp 5 / PN500) TaxID=670386 RepID=D3BFE5_HETP5|nr:hypothetical protein PPL_06679 [Heterostelium album PN500]EFA79859.1 hypothetical protein PPL_06679 [Heterostelium album PN500]|eukprot:XP_020431980.1 hypothetical protein PPL_06679 [Heterostelium album PN500]
MSTHQTLSKLSHHSIKQHPELYHTTVHGKKTLIHNPVSIISETSHQVRWKFIIFKDKAISTSERCK